MEVHAHTHTARKKWTHYFWEFLMLFLAVFCGFLAEYQLEHKIEKNKEKQFMRSIVEDLKADTAAIAAHNRQRNDRLMMFDSLTSAISEKRYYDNTRNFYYWGRNISRRVIFFSADGTMQQLKNSGGLRLISNAAIADKIIAYDVLYRTILFQEEHEETYLNEYRGVAAKIFDADVFNKMLKEAMSKIHTADQIFYALLFQRPMDNTPLKDSSSLLLNELANKINYWAAGSIRLLQLLEQLKKKAAELIESIKKEYHLN